MKVPVTTEVHSRIHFVTVPVFPEDACFLIMNWLICKCILAACWCLSTISNRRKGLIIITQLSWQRLVIPQGVFALLPLSWIQSAVDTALGKRQSDPLSMSCVSPTIALHKKKKKCSSSTNIEPGWPLDSLSSKQRMKSMIHVIIFRGMIRIHHCRVFCCLTSLHALRSNGFKLDWLDLPASTCSNMSTPTRPLAWSFIFRTEHCDCVVMTIDNWQRGSKNLDEGEQRFIIQLKEQTKLSLSCIPVRWRLGGFICLLSLVHYWGPCCQGSKH